MFRVWCRYCEQSRALSRGKSCPTLCCHASLRPKLCMQKSRSPEHCVGSRKTYNTEWMVQLSNIAPWLSAWGARPVHRIRTGCTAILSQSHALTLVQGLKLVLTLCIQTRWWAERGDDSDCLNVDLSILQKAKTSQLSCGEHMLIKLHTD